MVVQRPDRSARTVKEIGSPEENTSSASTTRQEPTLLDPLRHSLTNPLGVSVLKPDQTNRDVWAGGRFIAAAFTHEARTRAYKLYIPSSYRGQSLPHRRLRTNLPGRCHSSSRARPAGDQVGATGSAVMGCVSNDLRPYSPLISSGERAAVGWVSPRLTGSGAMPNCKAAHRA
jgi:hypothetical protein